MPISTGQSLAIILAVAGVTFFTRLCPFLVFNGKRQIPKIVTYLGVALPPAVIAVLVVYCVKYVDFLSYTSVLPQLIAILGVVLLHLWKRNNLISIGGGTALYMVLIQVVFK